GGEVVAGFLVGESLVKTQLYDLTVGPWQEIDHFPEQNKQFSFLGKNLRIQGRGSLVLERFLAAAEPFTMKVLGRVNVLQVPDCSLRCGEQKAPSRNAAPPYFPSPRRK
ncbi:MAG: hypothetical protein OXI92_14775, partial [Acidobacteriota bacterium]|nr:hypothetical protein [Acidobacteriota bacterium]